MIKSGTVFAGRYEIIERIGSGGMADVYKAHDARLKRDVAIKVLKSSLSEDAAFVEKFRTEGEAAASLTNANVVSVYDVGNVGSTYYIVMELIDGITLKDYIRRKGMLSSRETMAISAQVAVGLRAAHARHIVHRDIKPQNIILSRDGKVKVTDFGIARGVTDETRHGQKTELGSVHYIAPEQAKGQPCDERSDIYSLGIVMYEMITGRVPFDKDTQVAVALAHMNETMIPPSEINPDCPVALEQIIFRATQKSKERRYHNCTELLQDLRIAVSNPSFNFEKQEQETVLKSTTQVFAGPAVNRVSSFDREKAAAPSDTRQKGGTPLFQPNVPAVPGDDADYDEDLDFSEEAEDTSSGRQAMTIIDSEEKRPQRSGIREHRSAGAVIDFTELSPDQDFEDADSEDQAEENKDLFAEDVREDEKPLMDRIILIAGIVIGAVIICLLIYIFVTLSGCNQNAIAKTTASSSTAIVKTTEAPTTTETTTEEFIELSTKETEMFNEETDAIVPNVIGYYYEEAIQRLKDAGLEAMLGSQFGYSDEYPEMYIIKQSYPEGTIVEKGSTIVIMMSQGSDKFEIQEHYIGGTLSAFKNDAVNYPDINFVYEKTYSSTTPANHIISIDPSSGLVMPGDTVTVVYSLGAEFVAVPNLYGMYKGDVSTKLMYSALTIGDVSEEFSDDVSEGLVMGQSPAPDTTVRNGSTVNVIVSRGPRMEEVPGVIGMDSNSAVSAMEAAGFTVEIVEEVSAEYPEGQVISQDPVEGDYWPLKDPVVLTVAKAQTVMPNLVGGTLEDAQKQADALGFVIGEVKAEQTDQEEMNLLIKSQSVEPGTVIPAPSTSDEIAYEPFTVDLVYWAYEALPLVPDVTRATQDEATAALQAAGFAVAVSGETVKTEIDTEGGTVASTNPPAGTALKKGETVTITMYEYVAPTSSETEPPSSSDTEVPSSSETEAPEETGGGEGGGEGA